MSSPTELFDLTGRCAVVTGAAGLLGAEFCRTLSAAGANVLAADIDEPGAQAVAHSLTRPGSFCRVDVTQLESTRAMVEAALQAFGRVDILVNSAALDPKVQGAGDRREGESSIPRFHSGTGGMEAAPITPDPLSLTFEDYPLDLWNQALAVNLTGLFLCCQAVAKPMLAQGQGVIINICSIYGLVGPDQRLYQRPDQPPRYKPVYYSVSKAGLLGLTRYLATYFAGKNIRVNALTPGGVFNDNDQDFATLYAARTVLGRMARKDELNGALLFLASNASSYMTGANLVVDGGWTAW